MIRRGAQAAILCLFFSGCAGLKSRVASDAVGPQRAARREEAVREFEQRRDVAQLQAALDRWQQQDFAQAEALTTALVTRRPDFAEARLRLGEMLLSRGEAAAAETHLRAALKAEPQRADVHHCLGLALAAAGRSEEARTHFAGAAQLEPDNEIYHQTHDSAN